MKKRHNYISPEFEETLVDVEQVLCGSGLTEDFGIYGNKYDNGWE